MHFDLNQKIRIVHYCNQLSLGGTERTMEIFCRYLNPEKYEIYAISMPEVPSFLKKTKVEFAAHVLRMTSAQGKLKAWQHMNARGPNFQKILGKEKIFLAKNSEELEAILLKINPHVLHVHYSGRAEPPVSNEKLMQKIPVVVTTNQFEIENTAPSHAYVKKMFFVSNWMLQNKAHWAKKDPRAEVFYNPIEKPFSSEDLRAQLQIPKNAFVVGRVGRADPGIYDPMSLKAYREIQSENTYFLALAAPPNMIEDAAKWGLQNFVPLEASTDEVYLSKFYNTIDVLAHARKDGETFGCNIGEAMIHGKPVITHLTPFMNAQKETVGPAGFVCEQEDWKTYSKHLKEFRDSTALRMKLGAEGKNHALKFYEAKTLTQRLDQTYKELLSKS